MNDLNFKQSLVQNSVDYDRGNKLEVIFIKDEGNIDKSINLSHQFKNNEILTQESNLFQSDSPFTIKNMKPSNYYNK